jgi:SAM-dependent methyltransferase
MLKKLVKTAFHAAGLEIARRKEPYQLERYHSLFDAKTLAAKPFYNIGAGTFWHPYWTNIDFVSDWYASGQRDVIHHDLMSEGPLPIETSSAWIIYTSHTVEHVSEGAVATLFSEAHRALRPGGVLRVTTGPDAETDWRALVSGDASWFYWDDELYSTPGTYEEIYHRPANSVPIEERWLHHVASALAPNDISPSDVKVTADEIRAIIAERGFEGSLDYLTGQVQFDPARPGNHISWWSHPKLLQFLKDAGFVDAYRSGYWQSVSPVMRNSPLFDSTHPQISAYVEAVRR